MVELAADTEVSISPDVVSRTVAGEVLILDMASGTYHGLDPVGSRIWELIEERRTVGAILTAMVAEFDVDSNRARFDLHRLLGEMAGKGLVRLGHAAP